MSMLIAMAEEHFKKMMPEASEEEIAEIIEKHKEHAKLTRSFHVQASTIWLIIVVTTDIDVATSFSSKRPYTQSLL